MTKDMRTIAEQTAASAYLITVEIAPRLVFGATIDFMKSSTVVLVDALVHTRSFRGTKEPYSNVDRRLASDERTIEYVDIMYPDRQSDWHDAKPLALELEDLKPRRINQFLRQLSSTLGFALLMLGITVAKRSKR